MTLVEWLGEHGCRDVEPVNIKINRASFEGARYMQDRDLPPRTDEVLYLLGDLPVSYRRSRRTVYRLPGDERDWYVAAWVSKEVATSSQFGEFHYGDGPHFQLRPWSHSEAIDAHEAAPYSRVAVEMAAAV